MAPEETRKREIAGGGESVDAVDRAAASGPFEALGETIRRVEFVAALRRVEAAHPELPRLGTATRVREEPLRLSQHLALDFRGTMLETLERRARAQPWRLWCNFLGLFGANGPLPLHYTEYADQRARHHADRTFAEFVDLFNHRLLSLFYRASTHTDPAITLDRRDGAGVAMMLDALGGRHGAAALARDVLPDDVRRFHVARHADPVRHPDGIVALIGDYFGLEARVVEFVGGWLKLPGGALARLASAGRGTALGVASHIGRRVWSIGHRFRVRVGPLERSAFQSFRPGGERARALHDLVRDYVGDEWQWDLELCIAGGEIAPLRLDRRRSLGFDCWLAGERTGSLPERSVVLGRRRIATQRRRSGAGREQAGVEEGRG